MNSLAEKLDSIIEYEADLEYELDCEIFEVDFQHRDPLSEYLGEEIDTWAMDSLASTGFADY